MPAKRRPRSDSEIKRQAAAFRRLEPMTASVRGWLRLHGAACDALVHAPDPWSLADVGRVLTELGVRYATGHEWTTAALKTRLHEARLARGKVSAGRANSVAARGQPKEAQASDLRSATVAYRDAVKMVRPDVDATQTLSGSGGLERINAWAETEEGAAAAPTLDDAERNKFLGALASSQGQESGGNHACNVRN